MAKYGMKLTAQNKKRLMYAAALVAVGLALWFTRDRWLPWFKRESYKRTREGQQQQLFRERVDYVYSPDAYVHDDGTSKHAPLETSRVDFAREAQEVHDGRHMDKYDQYGVCTQGEYIPNDSKTRFDLMNGGEVGLAMHLGESKADAIEVDGRVSRDEGVHALSYYEEEAHRVHDNHGIGY